MIKLIQRSKQLLKKISKFNLINIQTKKIALLMEKKVCKFQWILSTKVDRNKFQWILNQ
jgi:hypothetical protein